MRLLLIRHGQTPANVLGQLDTNAPGPGLTDIGARQAAAIPAALQGVPVDALYASTLIRTQLTARPLAEQRALNVTVLDGLREVEPGDLEDLTDPASVDLYLSTAFAWAEGDLQRRIPGGPDGREFFARYDDAINRIVGEGHQTVAVFSHGMAIRAWAAARANNTDGSYAATHQLDNTAMITLEHHSTGWELVEWRQTPLGGNTLIDSRAPDPTGETLIRVRR